jgi:ketosteroid isomerase-like protein
MTTALFWLRHYSEEITMGKLSAASGTETEAIAVAKKCYQAYVDKDRAAIEQLIADDFRFSSPLDNRIDRQTYFARCWPNSENISDFKFIHPVNERDRVFVTYEGHSRGGNGFRNTEILTVRDAKLVEAEVYFGWSLPHEAPAGGFLNPDAQS